MAISVDYSVTPWLITIPKSDLTLDAGTKYNLLVDTLWQLLRDYADSAESMPNPIIYSRIEATASTPSITEINENYYSLEFEDGLYSVNIINGNTNVRNVEVKNQVSVNTNNTTGFVDQSFLEFSTFDGSVNVDETNGSAGQLYPAGTPGSPINNWADAEAVSDAIGLRTFLVYGASLLTGAALNFSDGHIFHGFSPVSASLVVDTSVNVNSCEFNNLTISGVLDGNSVFNDCIVGNINYINGFIDHSTLNGTILLGGNADASIHDCWQQVGGVVPVIDMGGSGQQLSVAGFKGHIKITNCAGAGNTYIDCDGIVELDATISSGTFTIFGNCEIINNTTGTAIISDKTSSKLTNAYLERTVWIDTELVAAGDGSQALPFNTLTAAIDYAETEGIKTIKVLADILIDRKLKNFIIEGIGDPTVDCNGQDLTKSEFSHCTLQGNYIGSIHVSDSDLLTGFYLNGKFHDCGLGGDLICTPGVKVVIENGYSIISGLGRPTISMNSGVASDLSVRGQRGGLTIKNSDHINDVCTIEMAQGSLTFDATNTDGTMVARGGGKFVDLATAAGASVFNEMHTNLAWEHLIEGAWSAEEMLRVMASALAGKVTGMDTNNPVFRDLSDLKNRITAITDANGNRSSVTLDKT